jgi:hypothetical protein
MEFQTKQEEEEKEESVSFISKDVQQTSRHEFPSNQIADTYRNLYNIRMIPETGQQNAWANNNEGNKAEFKPDSSSCSVGNVEILTAIAIPDTIRPPMLQSSTVHPSVSFATRLAILIIGLVLASLTYVDAFIFLTLNLFDSFSAQLAGVFWAFSCLSLIVGSVIGCSRGQWRYLAPGIVLSHLASVWINLVTEIGDGR